MGSGGTAPLTVNFCIRWRRLVSSIPQLLYPMGPAPLMFLEYEGFVDARTGLDALDYKQISCFYIIIFLGYPDCSIPH